MGTKIRGLEKYPAWAAVVVGLCVFTLRYASPRPSFDVHRNLFFTGIVIMLVAFATVIANEGDAGWNYWAAINVGAGVWLIVATTIIAAIPAVSTAQIVLGAVLAVIALATIAFETAYQMRRSAEKPPRG